MKKLLLLNKWYFIIMANKCYHGLIRSNKQEKRR